MAFDCVQDFSTIKNNDIRNTHIKEKALSFPESHSGLAIMLL